MRVVKCRGKGRDDFGPLFVYCGRRWGGYEASPLANWHSTHGPCTVCRIQHTTPESIAAFRRDLWRHIQAQSDVATALAALSAHSVLGCWCTSEDDAALCTTCHCGTIARAWLWLQQRP